ncbi:DUF3298 and DUF4163 domain-containing protein [Desulfovibrio sp. OttesenSCG-928-C14]|nr:DUF3298 and DUF4163 domain-containing protein [Desulfovibrio sp. OttesenSCG-928-C14]
MASCSFIFGTDAEQPPVQPKSTERAPARPAQAEPEKSVVPHPDSRAGFEFPQDIFKEENQCYRADLRTPHIGIAAIDEHISNWENDFYENAAAELNANCERGGQGYYILLDYETSATLGRVVSVLFNYSLYRGGAHPENVTLSMVFDIADGRLLGIDDIFAQPEGLAQFLSDFTYTALKPALGGIWEDTPSFMDGFSPNLSNFSTFVMGQEGLTLVFPTYQIAPYASGVQSCTVPLRELLRFMPRPGMWQ